MRRLSRGFLTRSSVAASVASGGRRAYVGELDQVGLHERDPAHDAFPLSQPGDSARSQTQSTTVPLVRRQHLQELLLSPLFGSAAITPATFGLRGPLHDVDWVLDVKRRRLPEAILRLLGPSHGVTAADISFGPLQRAPTASQGPPKFDSPRFATGVTSAELAIATPPDAWLPLVPPEAWNLDRCLDVGLALEAALVPPPSVLASARDAALEPSSADGERDGALTVAADPEVVELFRMCGVVLCTGPSLPDGPEAPLAEEGAELAGMPAERRRVDELWDRRRAAVAFQAATGRPLHRTSE